ncbi:MAG: agmatinase family protein [Gammaproteobacteria bacterium]|nr:agmatinase family protein [Gammaproteobacteria bacterium]
MSHFDPNAAAPADSGIFGLPYSMEESALVLIPIPWEPTTSYGGGTSLGPQIILNASKQVDLFDIDFGNFYEKGIHLLAEAEEVKQWNTAAKKAAQLVIEAQGTATAETDEIKKATLLVNKFSIKLNDFIYHQTKQLLSQGKIVGLIGGDHSSPFGAIQAFLEKYPNMGILHFDAHADLRNAYEGFEFSHASIMYNVITKTSLKKLVQVGIRDFCEEEFHFIKQNADRITTFFDSTLVEEKMSSKNWSDICDNIIQQLPNEVFVSFDIDGLDPRFCPNTGTPVPGGLDFTEALFLLKKVIRSGRKIIGFDLNEVSPGSAGCSTNSSQTPDTAAEWDANVGARLLYKLCGFVLT